MSASALMLLAAMTLGGEPNGIVLDIGTEKCYWCQQMDPVVKRLQAEGLPIRKIDANQRPDVASRFKVESYPTFILLVDGKEIARRPGAMPEEDLRQMLNRIPTKPTASTAGTTRPGRRAVVQPGINLGDGSTTPIQELACGLNRVRDRMAETGEKAREGLQRATEPLRNRMRGDESSEKDSFLASVAALGHNNRAPRRSAEPATAPVIRGNLDAASDAGAASRVTGEPMSASTRIRVHIDGSINLGSGTVVHHEDGRAIIVSCGHIFADPQSRNQVGQVDQLEVELFTSGRPEKVAARLLKCDLKADVSLIEVKTDRPIAVCRIASSAAYPRLSEAVLNIGCSGGENPTAEALEITAINKYEGPDNIECTGVPVQGRSGGGLFNEKGEVVGICIAADEQASRGLYAGLVAIHHLLDESQLAHLYQPATQAVAEANPFAEAEAFGEPQPAVAAPARTEFDPFANSQRSEPARSLAEVAPRRPAATDRAEAPASNFAPAMLDEETEVVCIIRKKGQPDAPSRIVIINQATPSFLAYLDGETVDNRTANRDAGSRGTRRDSQRLAPASMSVPDDRSRFGSRRTSVSNRPLSRRALSTPVLENRSIPRGADVRQYRQRSTPQTSIPTQSATTGNLRPTSLVKVAGPRRYVRSARSRAH